MAVPLSDLRSGAVARFHDAAVDPATRQLLGSLGLTGQCQLRLCEAGDLFIVKVRDTRIGLSRVVARSILVVPQIVESV